MCADIFDTGFELCVEACKSLIVSCALFEGQLTPEQAAQLSRLEVRFQVGIVRWDALLKSVVLCATDREMGRSGLATCCRRV